jgi:hypothetical protein
LSRRAHGLDRESDRQQQGVFGSAKEIELIQFMDAPFYRVQDDAGRTLLLTADHGPDVKDGFTESELNAAASAAMPGARVQDSVWLTRYDGYYYDRAGERPLPVLRVKYADADESWLYLSCARWRIVAARDGERPPCQMALSRTPQPRFPGVLSGWLDLVSRRAHPVRRRAAPEYDVRDRRLALPSQMTAVAP